MPQESLPRCDFDSDRLLLRLNFTVPADVDSISPIVSGLMQIVREMKCGEGKEFEIETSVREALANAIIHGAGRNPQKNIQICVGCDDQRGMLIVVRDPGAGFDLSTLPSPISGQNVFAEHGRGIFLINLLMDDVKFGGGGTEIHMRKR